MAKAPIAPAHVPDAAWATLLPAALAGTRLHAFAPLPGLTPNLGAEADAAEKQLLLTAANLALVRRAGQRLSGPAEALPPPEPAAPRQPLSAAAVALLLQTLPVGIGVGIDPYVSMDFLTRIYRAGYYVARADARLVLDALAEAGVSRILFMYPALLGRRGPWLAAAHPHPAIRAEAATMTTRWLSALPLERQWGTLRHWEKMGLSVGASFEQLLHSLQHPASPQELAKLLSVLASEKYRLPMAFRPVLEALAASESAANYEVRRDALLLLANLPGYDVAGRAGAYTATYLHLETSPTGLRLRMQLPSAWQRDWEWAGLQRSDVGHDNPANWLRMLLAATPPRYWAEAWGVAPAEAVALALGSEEPAVVLVGWLQATATYGDADFARALLAMPGHPAPSAYWSELLSSGYLLNNFWPHSLAAVQARLPAPEQLAWLRQVLPSLPPSGEWGTSPPSQLPYWAFLLHSVAGHGLALDQWLLAQLQAYATQALSAEPKMVEDVDILTRLLRSVSQHADPAVLPLVEAAAHRVDPHYAPLFRQVATDLAFRRDVAAAIPELPAGS